jgi:sugar phosphate isomerase/epimerase
VCNLLPYLDEYGLTLVLENHGEHATGEIIKSIVDQVASPRVLVNFDTANGIYYAGIDPVDDLQTCIDKVGYMHVKDKIGGPKEWNFPAPGQGNVNFPKIFDMLEKSGNPCPLSIEIEFTSAGPKDLAEVNEAVKESHQYLTGLGLQI